MSKLKSFLASWAGHLGGYVVSAAGIITAIDPKLIPPQYAFLTAVAGLVTVAAHNGYAAGKGSAVSAAVTAAANAAANALKTAGTATAALVLAGLLILPGLNGCSTIAKVNAAVTSPAAQPIITAAALVAVGTAEQHGITAAQISNIAEQALAADSGTTATLAAVGSVVNAQLATLKLPAADLAAAQIVEATLGAYIQAQVGSNATLAQSQAAVADVLKALITASGGTVPAGS